MRALNRTTSEKVDHPNLDWLKTADNLNSSGHAPKFVRLNETDLVKEQISNVSFVCLQGPSGSGKSTVALEAVREANVSGAFPPIRWYIAAEDRISLVKGLRDLAIKLKLATNVTKPWVAAKSVLRWLEDDVSGWILLLDNVDSFNDIKDLLPKSSRGRVVITLVEPEDLPETQACIKLEPLAMTASIELLLKNYSQTNDKSQAEAMAKAVKQLPLALKQAAALVAANPSTDSMRNLAEKLSSTPETKEDEEEHVYKALWREQETWLKKNHYSASLKLVRSMSLLSHRGVRKKLLEQCMTQASDEYDDLEGSLKELQRLGLVWTDSENRKVYMHQVNHEVIADGLLESGNGTADIFIDVLQCLQPRNKDPSSQWQWWYPASFHRVSDQTLWHIQSVLQKLESPRVKFLPASPAEFDKLNELTFTAILSSSGYVYHHHGKHDVQETVRRERKRWKKGMLQHALCTSLLAAVTSDSARRKSFKLHEESLKEMKNLVDKESRKEMKNLVQQEQYDFHSTVYRYIQANFLKFLAKADMKNGEDQDQDAQNMAKELESYLQNSTCAGNPEAHVHSALSRWYQRQQNFDKASDHLENCTNITRSSSTELHQEDNSSLEYFLNSLNQRRAHLLLAQGEGKAGQAFNLSQGVLESFEEQFGRTDPILARPWRLMGEARRALGNPEEGKFYCQKALDIVDANEVESVEKPLALFCLAKLSQDWGEKEILLRDAENGFKRINGPGNPETVECCLEGAALECDQQRYAKGLQKSLECRKMSRNDTTYNQSYDKVRVNCWKAWLCGFVVSFLCFVASLLIFFFLLWLMVRIWARLVRERSEIDSAAKKSLAKKIAVVIANSEYKSTEIENLEGPQEDVERVAKVFEHLGFQVLRFQNATLEGFESISKTLLQDVAGEDGIEVPVYYGGHGVELANEFHFVSVDAENLKDQSKLVGLNSFLPWNTMHLDNGENPRVPRAKFVFVIDACRAREPSSGNATKGKKKNKSNIRLAREQAQRIVFYACESGRAAVERAEGGVFTQLFVEILRDNPNLTLKELFKSIQERLNGTQGSEYQAPNLEDPYRAASGICLCSRPGQFTKFTVNLMIFTLTIPAVLQSIFCLWQIAETLKFLKVLKVFF